MPNTATRQRLAIIAEPVKGSDIRPGELFSSEGPDYWRAVSLHDGRHPIGERVFIRTDAPLPAGETVVDTYRLTIIPPVSCVAALRSIACGEVGELTDKGVRRRELDRTAMQEMARAVLAEVDRV